MPAFPASERIMERAHHMEGSVQIRSDGRAPGRRIDFNRGTDWSLLRGTVDHGVDLGPARFCLDRFGYLSHLLPFGNVADRGAKRLTTRRRRACQPPHGMSLSLKAPSQEMANAGRCARNDDIHRLL